MITFIKKHGKIILIVLLGVMLGTFLRSCSGVDNKYKAEIASSYDTALSQKQELEREIAVLDTQIATDNNIISNLKQEKQNKENAKIEEEAKQKAQKEEALKAEQEEKLKEEEENKKANQEAERIKRQQQTEEPSKNKTIEEIESEEDTRRSIPSDPDKSTNNPDSSDEETVWLSASGGKYHRTNHCGNMNPTKATQITRKEAKSRGIPACDTCF